MKIINPLHVLRRRFEEAHAPSVQCTLDPVTENAVRLHLVPPRQVGLRRHASLLHINGQFVIPLNHGNATLLRTFMLELKQVARPGEEISEEALRGALGRTARKMHHLYPEEPQARFLADLGNLQDMIFRVSRGEAVPELKGHEMTMAEYAKFMRGPVRMDLAVSPMRRDGEWACPNACIICYANRGAAMQITHEEELTTDQWFDVIDKIWSAGVVQISFTGGDPLERLDLPELVWHAQEFTTRVNTSAVTLTRELARRLHEAQLDVMQVTVYSANPAVHDALVGRESAWKRTMNGIHIAMEAGIEVSVNTPLVIDNVVGYTETLKFLHNQLGVRYFTVSGMLPAGGAKAKIASGGGVSNKALYAYLYTAKTLANRLGCELYFTSPGCLTDEQCVSLGMNPPTCGACLGNMAVAPDGEVIPCQSWVHNKRALGNILRVPWSRVWDHPLCREIRAKAANKNQCPLAQEA